MLQLTLTLLVIMLISQACFIVNSSSGKVTYRSPKANVLSISSTKDDASKDVSISVPPDLLELAGQLNIEEGATVASESLAAALNIGEGLQSAGPSINVSAQSFSDVSQIGRLELSIPYTQVASLALASGFLAIVYQVLDLDGKVLIGLIPSSNFAVQESFIKFKMLGLGSYQVVRVPVEIKEEIKVKTEETKILTKVEQEVLPALSLASINPIIARKGEPISIRGQNFRATVKLAYLGRPLTQIQIKSDQLLTAVIEDAPRRGQAMLYASQDGVEKVMSLAFAGAAGDFPLITLAANEVCSGQKFYNANGDLLEGSKSCGLATACSSDGQTNCTASTLFPAVQSSLVSSKCMLGESLGGSTGGVTLPLVSKVLVGTSYGVSTSSLTGTLTLPLAADVRATSAAYGDPTALQTPSYSSGGASNCNIDGDVSCLVDGTNFKAALIAGAAAKIITGQTLAGQNGTAAAAPANCGTNGGQSCVATGAYFAATSCSANGSNCFLPQFVTSTQPLKAISYDAIDAGKASIRSSLTLSGITGTLVNCSAGGETGCVTNSTFKSINLSSQGSNSSSGLTAANFNTKLATTGNFEFWDASGTRHEKAGDTDLAAANIATSVVIHGVIGSADLESHSACGAANQMGCVATSTYKTMDLSTVGAFTGLTGSNFPSRITNADSSEFWDATGNKHSFAGDPNLTVENIKSTVTILGVTGQYPSATFPLAANTSAPDLTSLETQLKMDGPFEFFDKTGAVYNGSGDSDLLDSNIKSLVAIENLSLTGTYVATLSCPSGYIKVPGDSNYGTGDFCIMKYEAKDVSGTATPQPASAPWVNVTQANSLAACRSLGLGYDLVNNTHWMSLGVNVASVASNWVGASVGSGLLILGHSDNSPNSACAASSNDTEYFVESTCTPLSTGDTADQRRTLTLTNGNVIWDLSGNVAERVIYFNLNDKPSPLEGFVEYTAITATDSTPLTDLIPEIAVTNTWNSLQGMGQFYSGLNGTGGTLKRGGYWLDNMGGSGIAGVFHAYMNDYLTDTLAETGFRCIAPPSP